MTFERCKGCLPKFHTSGFRQLINCLSTNAVLDVLTWLGLFAAASLGCPSTALPFLKHFQDLQHAHLFVTQKDVRHQRMKSRLADVVSLSAASMS